jgi:hypothetical protein
MRAKLFLISALALTLLSAIRYEPTRQTSVVIDTINASHTFGRQMIFNLSAHSDTDITAAALLMRTSDSDRTDIFQAKVTPGKLIKAQVTRDLQSQPISPFSTVTYTWRLTDSTGKVFTSPEQKYVYDDNRFNWQTTSRGAIVAHWYVGDLNFGQYIADVSFQALEKVSRGLNAPRPAKVDIYVYTNVNDLQSGLQLGGRTWVSGHADPQLGVVMVIASPDLFGRTSLERDIPHELGHVMIYQLTLAGYDHMPVWLDEGLAVNAELQPRPEFAVALQEAVRNNALIPFSALCASFSLDPNKALLSYAESASLTRYISDRWGSAKVKSLLESYRDGATCEGGVQRELNLSLPELQAEWQKNVLNANPLNTFLQNAAPAFCVFAPLALIIAMLIFVPKRKS